MPRGPSNKRLTISGEGSIRIEGLSDFSRALKDASDVAPARLRDANVRVAHRIVIVARTIAASIRGRHGGRSVQAKAAVSLRATRTLTSAAIEGGGPKAPWFYGAEFGAKQYKQFSFWRGNQNQTTWEGGPGYFLHPAIRVEGPASIREYMKTIDAITDEAFPA